MTAEHNPFLHRGTSSVEAKRESALPAIWALAPGLLLAAAVAGAAFFLKRLPVFSMLSPMILAIMIGMAVHNLAGTPKQTLPGVKFSMRGLLRLAIMLLGLQLTASQIADVGARGVAVIVASLIGTFLVTWWLGRRLGVDAKLAQLIGAGTSICGASAVIAANTVTSAEDEDVAYAVACVTVFGTISMFLYPLLPGILHLEPKVYGLWAGASIHEIAQVIAAAFQGGQTAGEFGTIAKLARVAMLGPLVIALALVIKNTSHTAEGRRSAAPIPIPWFVFGFLALMIVNSLVVIPASMKSFLILATTILLTVALAAMGLETNMRKLKARGVRPFLLGAASSLFIGGFSLALIKIVI